MTIKLTMAVATCQPSLLYESLTEAAARAHGEVDLVLYGNGCWIEPSRIPKQMNLVDLECSMKNRGVPIALHRLYELAHGAWEYKDVPADQHVVAYLHDDLFIREDGWNKRIERLFESQPDAVLAGFLGSSGLGRDEIYRDPYEFWHLSRTGQCFSNLGNAEVHGERRTTECEVVFVDGVAMCVRRCLLDKIGGWSWWPESCVHHAYDYGLSCMVRRHGGRVWLVPVAAKHGVGTDESVGGGITGGHSGTYNTKPYLDLVEKLGGDTVVHRAGHRWVYDNFRDVLPIRMR